MNFAHKTTKKINVPSVTVGISAYNEERNIGNLLDALLKQAEDNFSLDSIVVLCDGCTDSTASIVRKYSAKDLRIVLVDDGVRVGKIGRVNWLCKKNRSDILVIFDADIRIPDTKTVAKLVAGFVSPDVGLVAGLQVPESPRGFWESIFVVWDMIWVETRKNLNGGVSVHNISGCNFAMRKNLYKDLMIPKEVIAEDEFIFFAAQKAGLKFNFVSSAAVYYRLPGNLREYFLQSARFISTKYKIFEYFGESFEKEYAVPLLQKLRGLSIVFARKPFMTIVALTLQIPVRMYTRLSTLSYSNNTYEQIRSTK